MARVTTNDLPKSYGGKVVLRKKPLANGGYSLYLDLRQAKDSGKRYKFLGLRLLPENSPADKRTNLDTLQTADVAARDYSAKVDKAGVGIEQVQDSKLLCEIMAEYEQKRTDGEGCVTERSRRINDCSRHLAVHLGESRYDEIKMREVDKAFCEGFISYLKSARGLKKDVPLCASSQKGYLETFTSALNYAVREGQMLRNPMMLIESRDKVKVSKGKGREYLTINEVKMLAESPCSNEQVKNAFLFSCFCGLRISDILTLQWGNIEVVGDKTYINKIIQKTKEELRLKLSASAVRWLPQKPKGCRKTDLVFVSLPVKAYISKFVENWVKKCGIDKHISFHCARHTFATMSLTLGADLYVVSKLMGHSNVEVTQIYAKIIDERKEKAMDLLDSVLK